MTTYYKRKNRIAAKALAPILAAAIILPLILFRGNALADSNLATDVLHVLVGYSGMEFDEYVEVGTYPWYEIEQTLPVYEELYSYFSGDGEVIGGVYNSAEYNAIVSVGYGVYVTDILRAANIYYGDVRNILFYVNDTQGIWTAFDKAALFDVNRYYFEDMPGHREVIYNDFHNIIGYDFSEVWDHARSVSPMLALESSWEQYNQEFENAWPNYADMGTSTRFRLLYGQLEPTERMTRESAKWVSRVYITIYGQPQFGEIPELDGSYGSHTVEMEVAADNESIRDALSQFMQLNSTNENVLVIKGYTLIPDSVYSDKAVISIDYEIVGEGEAGITARAGRNSESVNVSPEVQGSPDPEAEPQSEEVTEPDPETEAGNEPADAPEDTPGGTNGEENAPEIPQSRPEQEQPQSREAIPEEPESAADIPETIVTPADEVIEHGEPEAIVAAEGPIIYKLSDDVMKNIDELIDSQITIPPDQDITQLAAEDKSEEKAAEERLMLILTGIGSLAVCVIGFAAGIFAYRIRLRWTRADISAKTINFFRRVFYGKYSDRL